MDCIQKSELASAIDSHVRLLDSDVVVWLEEFIDCPLVKVWLIVLIFLGQYRTWLIEDREDDTLPSIVLNEEFYVSLVSERHVHLCPEYSPRLYRIFDEFIQSDMSQFGGLGATDISIGDFVWLDRRYV